MSAARKRIFRLNQRLFHSNRRLAALRTVIDAFNYAGGRHLELESSVLLSAANRVSPSSSKISASTSSNIHSQNRKADSSSSSSSSISSGSSDYKNDLLCDSDHDGDDLIGTEDSSHSLHEFPTRDDFESTTTHLTLKEISVLLVQLRCRHSLTKSCITDICQLLQVLRVPNAPTCFKTIEGQILSNYASTIFPTQKIICPSCFQISSDLRRCTTNHNCESKHHFIRSPTVNYTFALEPQIRSIVAKNSLKFQKSNNDLICDITDGRAYKKLLEKETDRFLTLLMNSDGSVIKTISKSIWLTGFVINELPRSIRFLPQNMVIGMISTGSTKPKKDEMLLIMRDLVDELHRLEKGIFLSFSSNDTSQSEQLVKVFLFASVCDKPATSLILNHTECTGYYGCIHCTIKGNASDQDR